MDGDLERVRKWVAVLDIVEKLQSRENIYDTVLGGTSSEEWAFVYCAHRDALSFIVVEVTNSFIGD